MRRAGADLEQLIEKQRLQETVGKRCRDQHARPRRGRHRHRVRRLIEHRCRGEGSVDQNNPAISAAIHTITRAPANSIISDSATTPTQPKNCDRCTTAPRFDPRQGAQYQIPSHCVAHS